VRTLEVTEFALEVWKADGVETLAWKFFAPLTCGIRDDAARRIVEENNIMNKDNCSYQSRWLEWRLARLYSGWE